MLPIGLNGSYQSSIRGLESLKKKFRQIEYATLVALIWFHQRAQLIDEEKLRGLESELKQAETRVQADDALIAADFLFHTKSYEAASDCLSLPPVLRSCHDNVATQNPEVQVEKYRILCWLRLYTSTKMINVDATVLRSALQSHTTFKTSVDCLMIQAM